MLETPLLKPKYKLKCGDYVKIINYKKGLMPEGKRLNRYYGGLTPGEYEECLNKVAIVIDTDPDHK